MRRWSNELIVLAAATLVGCLFPSSDDLRSGTDRGSSGGKSSSGGSSGSTTSSGSSSGTGSSTSSSGDAATSTKGVVCGTATCLPEEFCCLSVGGTTPVCQPIGAVGTCAAQLGGLAFTCDGNEDCRAGDICCGEDQEASCAAACEGQALCNAPSSTCPSGKSCTGTFSGFKACQ